MDVTKMKKKDPEQKNELHDWIDAEVPQIIDDEVDAQNPEFVIDKESLKAIEKEVTKLLKEYFK